MYDEDLTNLDEGIRRLKVEYDIFFNGNRKRPPDDLRMRIEKLVKRLSEATDMSFAQRFRYNTLIARFYVFRDLWRRTQQDRESTASFHEEPSSSGRASPAPQRASAPLGEAKVSITDPEGEAEKIRHLYEELLRIRGKHAQSAPSISYQQFADYVASQTQSIKQKYQCRSVVFRIALEEKAIKFTAKADSKASG